MYFFQFLVPQRYQKEWEEWKKLTAFSELQYSLKWYWGFIKYVRNKKEEPSQ